MARARAKDESNITIRMDRATREKLTRLAERRGLKLGPLLRSLGLETAEQYEAADRLRRQLEKMEPDEEGAVEGLKRRRAERSR
ncbi:MAG: hypothetical protein WCC48_10525 [Anaeromyxobacteraceae bacterium]